MPSILFLKNKNSGKLVRPSGHTFPVGLSASTLNINFLVIAGGAGGGNDNAGGGGAGGYQTSTISLNPTQSYTSKGE